MRDGIYLEKAAGHNGELTPISIEIKDNKIKDIKPQEVLEPNSIKASVYQKLAKKIIQKQSLDVDAISGATQSSQGLFDSIVDAVHKAGGTIEPHKANQDTQVQTDEENKNSDNYAKWRKVPEHIDRVINTDFLIVGAGISGLAAAVQARQDGMQTLVLEKNNFVAGNGGGVEGIFGVNSEMQKKAHIETNPGKIIAREQEMTQYRANGSFWVDIINNSADNIKWLQDNGVQITKVGDYHGTCEYATFHWFKGGHASIGYVPYMKKKADELGAKFLFDTPAISIRYDGNKVTGVYAKNQDSGEIIQVNAKAVLLASGGVGHNPQLLQRQGWNPKHIHYLCMPSNNGDGYHMAMAVGAKDMLLDGCEFTMNCITALPHTSMLVTDDFAMFTSGGPVIWVDQNGRRFINENVKKSNMMFQSAPMNSNQDSYQIFNADIFHRLTSRTKNADEILAHALKINEGNSLYKAETIEELANKFKLPVQTLVKTVNDYNEFCKKGEDLEFDKDKDCLISMDKGPYYIGRIDLNNLVGLGGIEEDSKFEVIDENRNPISGLYASGVDSTMQYRNIYTINLGGSACGHDVNSGRYAAINANKYISSLN